MKKLGYLFLLFLSSCAYSPVDSDTEISKVVLDSIMVKKVPNDTLYLFKDERLSSGGYHYYFKQNYKTKQLELTYKYEAINNMVSLPGTWFIGLIGISVAIGLFIGGAKN